MTNRWLLLALLWAAQGCVGGQSTGELDDGPRDDLNDRCRVSLTPLTPEEVSPLGFAADDVLSFATGSHERDLTWLTPSPGMLVNPLPGTTTLHLQLERDAGEIQYVDSEPRDELSTGDASCLDRVEIPVIVALSTLDGGLDEQFETQLVAWEGEAAEFSHVLAAEQLGGSLSASVDGEPNAALTLVEVETMLREGVVFGLATGEVEGPGSGGTTINYDVGDLAMWGSPNP